MQISVDKLLISQNFGYLLAHFSTLLACFDQIGVFFNLSFKKFNSFKNAHIAVEIGENLHKIFFITRASTSTHTNCFTERANLGFLDTSHKEFVNLSHSARAVKRITIRGCQQINHIFQNRANSRICLTTNSPVEQRIQVNLTIVCIHSVVDIVPVRLLFTPGFLNIFNALENHVGKVGEISGVLCGLFHSLYLVV